MRWSGERSSDERDSGRVRSVYLAERSDPAQHHWMHAYRVTISNEGDAPARLVARHWIITNAHGVQDHVQGPGVVGGDAEPQSGRDLRIYLRLPARYGDGHDARQLSDGLPRWGFLRCGRRSVHSRRAVRSELIARRSMRKGTMKIAEKSARIHAQLEALYPTTPVPLDHTDPFTLLVAVMLSAQTTDKKVNEVTPALFAAASDPACDGRTGSRADSPLHPSHRACAHQGQNRGACRSSA